MNISIGHTVVGLVILIANEDYKGNFGNLEYKFAEVAANFIGKQLE